MKTSLKICAYHTLLDIVIERLEQDRVNSVMGFGIAFPLGDGVREVAHPREELDEMFSREGSTSKTF